MNSEEYIIDERANIPQTSFFLPLVDEILNLFISLNFIRRHFDKGYDKGYNKGLFLLSSYLALDYNFEKVIFSIVIYTC